jgi:hypothetical protein
MEPSARGSFIAADAASGMHAMHAASPHLLTIRFVAIRGGYVEGALEPYIAPDCQCVVQTVFRGRRAGEEIRGQFVTQGQPGPHQTGTWSVRRIRPVAGAR